jgi:hypothetical protein
VLGSFNAKTQIQYRERKKKKKKSIHHKGSKKKACTWKKKKKKEKGGLSPAARPRASRERLRRRALLLKVADPQRLLICALAGLRKLLLKLLNTAPVARLRVTKPHAQFRGT